MPERNSPACPLHGDLPRARHPHNFYGIVSVIDTLIETISGVGTTSFTRCPYGYAPNFEGVVRALEDLNSTASGITAGGGGRPRWRLIALDLRQLAAGGFAARIREFRNRNSGTPAN